MRLFKEFSGEFRVVWVEMEMLHPPIIDPKLMSERYNDHIYWSIGHAEWVIY